MTNHVHKIAFFVVDKRHFDYYGNVLKALEKQAIPFEVVINDKLSEVKSVIGDAYEREMVEVAVKTGFPFTTLSQVLDSKIKYEVVVTTFTFKYRYRSGKASIRESVVRAGYRAFQKVLRLTRSVLLSSSLESWLNEYELSKLELPETLIGRKIVQFPKGMDIHLGRYPDPETEPLIHHYLCHGRFDSSIIAQKSSKPYSVIGYPRYDDLVDPELAKARTLRNEFGIPPDKPIVTWLPTYVPRQGNPDFNIDHWAPYVATLQEQFAVIVRPHPKRVEKDRDLLLNKLSAFGFFVDLVAERDMSEMYAGSEFTVCDYGGVVFSAVYTDKKLILLNHPDHEETAHWKQNINVYRIRDILRSIDYSSALEDPDILLHEINHTQRWDEQAEVRKRIREEYFGGVRGGEGSDVTARELAQILKQV